MAITSHIYPIPLIKVLQGTLTWKASAGTDWRAQLVQDSYDPDASHDFLNDVTPLATGGNGEQDMTITDPTHVDTVAVACDASDATLNFGAVTDTEVIGGMVVYNYNSGGATSTQDLICINDFVGSNVTADGSNDIIITYGTNGIWRLTYTDF